MIVLDYFLSGNEMSAVYFARVTLRTSDTVSKEKTILANRYLSYITMSMVSHA